MAMFFSQTAGKGKAVHLKSEPLLLIIKIASI